MITTRNFKELIALETFEERLNYLKCFGHSFEETFGPNRWINQDFYRSKEWKRIRNFVIARDNGLDLAILPMKGKTMVHHIEPITLEDIENGSDKLFDLNNLITVSFDTHQVIHGFDRSMDAIVDYVPRERNDTCPWKRA